MNYPLAIKQLQALFEDEHDMIANMANMSALIYETMPNVNWVGFYLSKGEQLVLGPFQGKVACVRINLGKGVCGTAAADKKSLLVENVHEFAGHIACDSASNSELAVPIIKDGKVWGVFDLDSPDISRFKAEDKQGIENLVEILIKNTNFEN